MTVSSVVVRAVAAWTGAETEFPTGIQILDRSQLVVSLVPDEGDRQVLTLGLQYSIDLSPAGIATVVPLGAFPASPGSVSFVRQTPMAQTYDPTATDTYDAVGHAAALDQSAMRVAELSQKVDDIEAVSIVVAGGAASVPAGSVYVSDGEGGAVAGPTSTEIETARAQAVSAAGTATGAAGVATNAAGIATGAATAAGDSAALADQLANAAPDTPVGSGYSGRHWVAEAAEIAAHMAEFGVTSFAGRTGEVVPEAGDYTAEDVGAVPTGRKIMVGAGLSLDGATGSDEAPAEGDLSADRRIALDLAAKALTPELWAAGTDATEAPISPEKLAWTIAALAPPDSALSYTEFLTSTTWSKPADLDPDALVLTLCWGGGGGYYTTSASRAGGGGGSCSWAVWRAGNLPDDVTVTIGAGGGGNGAGGTTWFHTQYAYGGGSGTSSAGGAGGDSGFGSAFAGGAGGSGSPVAGANAFWGGGGGAGQLDNNTRAGGTSVVGGAGAGNNNSFTPQVPGGGGTNGHPGAAGMVRLFIIE